jgi:hypothetical protein
MLDWMLPMLSGSRPSSPMRRSTAPSVPKDMMDFPVLASTSCSRPFIAKIKRWSPPSALSQ